MKRKWKEDERNNQKARKLAKDVGPPKRRKKVIENGRGKIRLELGEDTAKK